MRSLLTSAAVVACLAAPLAQALSFDVVSIKRNTSGTRLISWGTPPGGGFSMTNGVTLNVIYSGFTLKNRDIVGLPDWVNTERYDVVGTTTVQPSRERLEAMVRQLLADHFKLRWHVEQHEQPVYALVLARPDRPLPPAMQRLALDCEALRAAAPGGRVAFPVLPNGETACGYSIASGNGTVLTARGMTLATLADRLDTAAGRIVIDRTGLAGDYAFTLSYDAAPSATSDVTIFTALQEQLGLKLEPARAPVDTLVIDHIERPDVN